MAMINGVLVISSDMIQLLRGVEMPINSDAVHDAGNISADSDASQVDRVHTASQLVIDISLVLWLMAKDVLIGSKYIDDVVYRAKTALGYITTDDLEDDVPPPPHAPSFTHMRDPAYTYFTDAYTRLTTIQEHIDAEYVSMHRGLKTDIYMCRFDAVTGNLIVFDKNY
jgi:hypothetical protein